MENNIQTTARAAKHLAARAVLLDFMRSAIFQSLVRCVAAAPAAFAGWWIGGCRTPEWLLCVPSGCSAGSLPPSPLAASEAGSKTPPTDLHSEFPGTPSSAGGWSRCSDPETGARRGSPDSQWRL